MFSGTICAFAGECGPDVLDAAPSVQALLRAVLRRVAHGHVQLAVHTCGEKISMAANYVFMVTTLMSTKIGQSCGELCHHVHGMLHSFILRSRARTQSSALINDKRKRPQSVDLAVSLPIPLPSSFFSLLPPTSLSLPFRFWH